MIPFSILDLAPIPAGGTAADALRNSLDLAQHAEVWGYRRYWVAEHHNMVGIASAATAVVIGHVAAGTKTIRVGSGGIMLPNHSPLVIAEQFGTLASLFPGRIDLGLGRAPGTDMLTARALRRDLQSSAEQFPEDVLELQRYLEPAEPGQNIRAVPGAWLPRADLAARLELVQAQLAAMLGLPFAFASHFAPHDLMPAIDIYRSRFEPSRQLDRPYIMLGVNVIAADTDDEARRQFTTVQQAFINLRRGTPTQVPPPIDDMESYWTPAEKARIEDTLVYSFIGSPTTIEDKLRNFIAATAPDEIMAAAHLYDHTARLRSYEITTEVRHRLGEMPADQNVPNEATTTGI